MIKLIRESTRTSIAVLVLTTLVDVLNFTVWLLIQHNYANTNMIEKRQLEKVYFILKTITETVFSTCGLFFSIIYFRTQV